MKKVIIFLLLAVAAMLVVTRSRDNSKLVATQEQTAAQQEPEPQVLQPAEVVVSANVETNTSLTTNVVKPRRLTIVIDPQLGSGSK